MPSHFGNLLLIFGPDGFGLVARLLQVALREAEPLGHHGQVALQAGIGRVDLRLMLLQLRDLGGEIRVGWS